MPYSPPFTITTKAVKLIFGNWQKIYEKIFVNRYFVSKKVFTFAVLNNDNLKI